MKNKPMKSRDPSLPESGWVARELQESRERFYAVLEGMNAGVYAADMATYEIIFANKYMRDTFGDIVKRPCWQVLQTGQSGPCDFCRSDELLGAEAELGKSLMWEHQNTITGRWYYIQDRTIRWVDGRVVRLSVHTDITQRKIMEEELRRAKEKAEEATHLKDKFISLVAHDLRSPCIWIVGFLKRLLKDRDHPLHESHEELIKRVLASGENMAAMIDNLLKISRLQTGKIMLASRFIDLHQPLRFAFGNFSHLAEAKGIELANDIPQGFRVYGDPELLCVLIQNLLSNAIKFCRKGDRITFFSPGADKATFAVQDTGVGMDQKFLQNIFRHEEKTTTLGTAGEGGTGLGLPLCHDIITAHGGTIEVESKEGRGSVFYVKLPAVRPKILLVEDAKPARMIFRHALEQLDVDVLEAENGEIALALLRDYVPHLVITDLTMPVMDGFQLMERIRSRPEIKAVPIIVLTSDSSMETREKAIRLGADDFVTKTAGTEEFLPRVLKFVA